MDDCSASSGGVNLAAYHCYIILRTNNIQNTLRGAGVACLFLPRLFFSFLFFSFLFFFSFALADTL